ncbi:hypothetical protein KSP40_PGU016743 [Platanthera guangdongensis]|uniref:Uncharacterized protein n=1 Tax=Platanthera guangdongensis TaxID=2320717 RepID=A0ABR2M120_9ASPA
MDLGRRRFEGQTVTITNLQVSMPRSTIFLLTDPATVLPIDRKNVTLFPILGDYSRGQLMLQRIRFYIREKGMQNLETITCVKREEPANVEGGGTNSSTEPSEMEKGIRNLEIEPLIDG